MKHYTQLAREQRYQIYALKKAGLSQTRMADLIGVHKSTISRELRRNSGQRGYRPRQAHLLAQQRHQEKPRGLIQPETWQRIETQSDLIGVPNRSPTGCNEPAVPKSVMNGSTNTFWQTKKSAATCTSTYAAKSNARNAMAPESGAASFLAE